MKVIKVTPADHMRLVSAVYAISDRYVEMKYQTAGTPRAPATVREQVVVRIEYKDRLAEQFTVDLDALDRGDSEQKAKIREIAAAAYGYRPTSSEVYDLRKEIERYATR